MKSAGTPWRLLPKLLIDMFSAVSGLVVAQQSSGFLEGLINYSVLPVPDRTRAHSDPELLHGIQPIVA